MRLVVCAPQPLFAESLTHLLELRGIEVMATVGDIDAALVVLRERPADICLIDLTGEITAEQLTQLFVAVPETRYVLLVEDADQADVADVGVAVEKRARSAELLEVLKRVHARAAPDTAPGVARLPSARPRRDASDRSWLAAFLTPRERQVLTALVCGHDTVKLARSMGISPTTARCHIQSVLNKLGAHSRLEAVTVAVREGMVSPRTGEWLIDLAS